MRRSFSSIFAATLATLIAPASFAAEVPPQIVIVPADSHPPVPSWLKVTCLMGADSIVSNPNCPVIKYAAASRTVAAPKPGKIDKIIVMMRRPKGASINDLTKATAWQAHSVRGAISRTLRKKQGLNVVSEKSGDVRLYRIADKAVV